MIYIVKKDCVYWHYTDIKLLSKLLYNYKFYNWAACFFNISFWRTLLPPITMSPLVSVRGSGHALMYLNNTCKARLNTYAIYVINRYIYICACVKVDLIKQISFFLKFKFVPWGMFLSSDLWAHFTTVGSTLSLNNGTLYWPH